MPIFVEWKWVEKTETFLAIFHFWDDRQKGKENLRMRVIEEGFELLAAEDKDHPAEEGFTWAQSVPYCGLHYPETNAYLSWAPSHAEFCFLTEVLTYANLINGLKPHIRKRLRLKLQGKQHNEIRSVFEIDTRLLDLMDKSGIITFATQEALSFEIRLEYINYLRELIKPYI